MGFATTRRCRLCQCPHRSESELPSASLSLFKNLQLIVRLECMADGMLKRCYLSWKLFGLFSFWGRSKVSHVVFTISDSVGFFWNFVSLDGFFCFSCVGFKILHKWFYAALEGFSWGLFELSDEILIGWLDEIRSMEEVWPSGQVSWPETPFWSSMSWICANYAIKTPWTPSPRRATASSLASLGKESCHESLKAS